MDIHFVNRMLILPLVKIVFVKLHPIAIEEGLTQGPMENVVDGRDGCCCPRQLAKTRDARGTGKQMGWASGGWVPLRHKQQMKPPSAG